MTGGPLLPKPVYTGRQRGHRGEALNPITGRGWFLLGEQDPAPRSGEGPFVFYSFSSRQQTSGGTSENPRHAIPAPCLPPAPSCAPLQRRPHGRAAPRAPGSLPRGLRHPHAQGAPSLENAGAVGLTLLAVAFAVGTPQLSLQALPQAEENLHTLPPCSCFWGSFCWTGESGAAARKVP